MAMKDRMNLTEITQKVNIVIEAINENRSEKEINRMLDNISGYVKKLTKDFEEIQIHLYKKPYINRPRPSARKEFKKNLKNNV